MRIPEKIVGFLNRNRGLSFCDSCIQNGCLLASPGQVARITATLELFPEFLRTKSTCSECARHTRLTTRAV